MYPRDVFPDQEAGLKSASKRTKFKGQVATRVIHSEALAGDREGLAGGSSDKKVNWADIRSLYLGEVAQIGHMRVMVLEHGTWERLDLGERNGRPAQRMPSCGGSFDT